VLIASGCARATLLLGRSSALRLRRHACAVLTRRPPPARAARRRRIVTSAPTGAKPVGALVTLL
jgi:hypothetical protein